MKPNKPSGLLAAVPAAGAPITLSKSVMSMKFMKRKEDEKNQIQDQREKLHKLQGGNWTNSKAAADPTNGSQDKLKCVRDYSDLYAALPGRRSFNGCNKAIEKYYQSVVSEKYEQSRNAQALKDTVDDEEMVQRYQDLVGLPRGPSQGKKPSFLRPEHRDGSSKKRKGEGDSGFMKLSNAGMPKKQKKH